MIFLTNGDGDLSNYIYTMESKRTVQGGGLTLHYFDSLASEISDAFFHLSSLNYRYAFLWSEQYLMLICYFDRNRSYSKRKTMQTKRHMKGKYAKYTSCFITYNTFGDSNYDLIRH